MSDDGLLHDRCHVDDGPVRAGKAVSETPECANCKRLKLWAETARDLQIERDDLRVMWERESTALGAAIGQRDRISAIAEDNRARYVTAERERDELREALRELVRLKDLKDWIEQLPRGASYGGYIAANNEYDVKKPLAWDKARAILAGRRVT